MMERECGTCYACCVWLDIEILRKKGGRPCKHLSHRKPEARCSIYARRPEACSGFQCAWLGGMFDDDMRPNESGLLVVMYEDPEHEGKFLVTINVTDGRKCGTLEEGPLAHMLHWIFARMGNSVYRVNLLNRRTGRVVEFSNGEIWEARLLPGTKLEELQFLRLKVVGHYHAAESIADIPPGLITEGSVILR